MNSKDFLKEGFVDDAHDVHLDHEVQMAREECYHAAEHALALHKLLRNVSEQQGLEGWVSAKITLANEYLNTVREHLEYELLQGQVDDMDSMAIGLPVAEDSKKKPVNDQPVDPTQGVAEGLDIDFNKNFAYQRDIAKKSPAYVTGFKDGYHNKPKNDMKFPSGDERKNYKLGYRDGQSGHTKRVDEEDYYLMSKKGVAEGYSLKKTNVDKYMEPGDPDEYTQDINIKDTDYEIINNKTGQVVGTASWTTNDYFGPGALKITMKNGATRYLDIWDREKGNPQTAFNRFMKDPKTAKKYKEQGVAEGKKSDRYHIVGKDGKPVNLASYADRDSAIKDRDEKYPGAVVQQVGPRGKVKGVAEGAKCNHTMEGTNCPVHGLKECPMSKVQALAEWKKEQRILRAMESSGGTSAGAVAGVTNPGGKPKSQVGSLFGGTYKQPKKAKKA